MKTPTHAPSPRTSIDARTGVACGGGVERAADRLPATNSAQPPFDRPSLRRRMLAQASLLLAGITSLIGAVGCGEEAPASSLPTTGGPHAATTLTLATISESASEIQARYAPFAHLLATRLATAGIDKVLVRTAPTMLGMAHLLETGEVDIFIDSPFPILTVAESTGVIPLLRRWKNGTPEYHSVIFARADSGIETLSDLLGKHIAFEGTFSTSGFFLPKAYLLEQGLTLVEVSSVEGRCDEGLSYSFSKDEENSMYWVLAGRVDCAALGVSSFEELSRGHESDLVILGRTASVPRHILAVRHDLDSSQREALRRTLLSLHKTDEGLDVLHQFKGTTKFDEFPGGADSYLLPVRKLIQRVRSDLHR